MVIMVISFQLFSIPNPLIISEVLLKEIYIGDKDGEIGFFSTPSTDKGGGREIFCKGLGFDFDNNIYFADLANERYLVYNYDLDFFKKIQTKFSGGVQLKFLTNDLIFRYSNSREFSIVDINKKELLARVYLDEHGEYNFSRTKDNFIYYNNTVFHWTNNGEIVSFVNPGLEENKSFTPPEETRKNIKKKKYKGLKIDDQDRLFLNGKLLTRNYFHFTTYWADKHKSMISPSNVIDYDYMPTEFTSGPIYCGEDNDGNTYWTYSIFDYLIFNKDGWLIDIIEWERDKEYDSYNYPATIQRYGDIYIIALNYKQKKYELIMLPRTWGYDPKPGICAEDNVRVRVRPSIKADVVTALKKDEKIEILDKTDEKMKIDNMENYWIKIKTKDGKYGWAYGEWIKIEAK